MKGEKKEIRGAIAESCKVKKALDPQDIIAVCDLIEYSLEKGGKLLICGNGGSAADAQHMAAELVGRFMMEREAMCAISLSTDTSILTALANDYGREIIFARQVEALGNPDDVLLALTTSGKSENILSAIAQARSSKMKVAVLTGKSGSALAKKCDASIICNSKETPRIQEAHSMAIHLICAILEKRMFG